MCGIWSNWEVSYLGIDYSHWSNNWTIIDSREQFVIWSTGNKFDHLLSTWFLTFSRLNELHLVSKLQVIWISIKFAERKRNKEYRRYAFSTLLFLMIFFHTFLCGITRYIAPKINHWYTNIVLLAPLVSREIRTPGYDDFKVLGIFPGKSRLFGFYLPRD